MSPNLQPSSAQAGRESVRAVARAAFATPDLRRLQAAWAAAAIGGWVFMVTLAVHAYAVGGAAAVGLAALVRMAPAGLAAPLMGLAADRFARRDVLLVATLARAALLGAVALSADAPFAVVLGIAVLFTVAQTAHKPAQAALLPRLTEDPAAANAVWSGIDNAAFVLGALAGGALVATLGVPAAFAAGALAFTAAAALLAGIARDPAQRTTKWGQTRGGAGRRREGQTRGVLATGGAHAGEPLQGGEGQTRGVLAARREGQTRGVLESSEALAGLRLVARDRDLRVLVGVLSASTLVEGMIDVLVVVTALRVVDLGDAGVGWLNSAWGVGGLAGGAIALAAHRHVRLALPAGCLLVGLPLLALAVLPLPAAALVLLVVLGVGYSLVEVAGLTLLQRLAQDAVRARAFAVVESSYWLTTGAGAMLAPLIVAVAGPRGALAVVGAALPLVVLARWAAISRLGGEPAPALAYANHAGVPFTP